MIIVGGDVDYKFCVRCQTGKPVTEFGKWIKGDGYFLYCRLCSRQYSKQRGPRKRTKEHHREKCLKSKYGISTEDYNLMFAKQNGMCKICGTTNAGNRYGKLEVEHCHDSGKVRGLVCHSCNNAVMWYESWLAHPQVSKVVRYVEVNR